MSWSLKYATYYVRWATVNGIREIAEALSELDSTARGGFDFDYQIIPTEQDVLQITLTGREEIPVYVTLTDTQILCIAYLWDESQIKPETRGEMIEMMLEMNIPMPLSSFAKIGNQYAVFGALSVHSRIEDIALEIAILSDNGIDAIEVMSDYLR